MHDLSQPDDLLNALLSAGNPPTGAKDFSAEQLKRYRQIKSGGDDPADYDFQDFSQEMLEAAAFSRVLSWLKSKAVGLKAEQFAGESRRFYSSPTYETFMQAFTAFPASVFCWRDVRTPAVDLGDLFGDRYRNLTCVRRYLQALDQVDVEKTWLVMFFPARISGRSKWLAMHNYKVTEESLSSDDADTKIIRRFKQQDSVLALESLQSFLKTTGISWFEHLVI